MIVFALISCSKEEDATSNNGTNNGGNTTPSASWTDTLSKRWKVSEAYHNGSQDASSKDLLLEFRKDGSYTLLSTGFVGTWAFQKDATEILLDKGNTSFETLWTIQSISSQKLDVKFVSPFTGGQAQWILNPLP